MNKAIIEIKKKIEQLESEKADIITNGNRELKEAKSKLEELTAKRDNCSNSDEYIQLTKEIQDTEFKIEFTNKKLFQVKNGFISSGELSEIKKTIDSEIAKLQEERAPAIKAEVEKLVQLMDIYADEAEELDILKDRAGNLTHPTASHISSRWSSGEIGVRFPTIFGFWEAFWEAYFKRRYIISLVKKDPEAVLNPKIHKYSPEEKAVALALLNEGKS